MEKKKISFISHLFFDQIKKLQIKIGKMMYYSIISIYTDTKEVFINNKSDCFINQYNKYSIQILKDFSKNLLECKVNKFDKKNDIDKKFIQTMELFNKINKIGYNKKNSKNLDLRKIKSINFAITLYILKIDKNSTLLKDFLEIQNNIRKYISEHNKINQVNHLQQITAATRNNTGETPRIVVSHKQILERNSQKQTSSRDEIDPISVFENFFENQNNVSSKSNSNIRYLTQEEMSAELDAEFANLSPDDELSSNDDEYGLEAALNELENEKHSGNIKRKHEENLSDSSDSEIEFNSAEKVNPAKKFR